MQQGGGEVVAQEVVWPVRHNQKDHPLHRLGAVALGGVEVLAWAWRRWWRRWQARQHCSSLPLELVRSRVVGCAV